MMQMLGQGFLVSLQLFVLTLLGSIPLGIPVAFMRMSKIAPLRWIARIYISVMRGTPLMLQMFAIYFAPYYVFGISLTPDSKWTACVVAFIEMFSTAKALVASQVSMVPFAIAALIYWVFNFVVEMLLGAAEKKLDYYHD